MRQSFPGGVAGVSPLGAGSPSRSSKSIVAGGGSASDARVAVKPIMRPAKMTATQMTSDAAATVLPTGGAEGAWFH